MTPASIRAFFAGRVNVSLTGFENSFRDLIEFDSPR